MATQGQQQKGSFGCLGYGCVVALALMLAVFGGVCLYVVSSFRSAVDKYTAPSGPALKISEPTDAARSSAGEKMLRLETLLKDPAGRGEESLTGDEVTAAVQSWVGRTIELRFVGETFESRFAVPLSLLYRESLWPMLLLGSREGRFAVGEASGRLSFKAAQPPELSSVVVSLGTLRLNEREVEGDALVRASEWFSGWASAEVNAPQSPDLNRPSLAGRLAGLELKGSSLVVRVEP